MIHPLISMGAAGLVSSLANLFPEIYVELFSSSRMGDAVRTINGWCGSSVAYATRLPHWHT